MARKSKKANEAVAQEAQIVETQVENQEVQNKAAENKETAIVEEPKELSEVDLKVKEAEDRAKELKEALAEAKRKLAEAKAAQKRSSSRPIRLWTFILTVIDADEPIIAGEDIQGEFCVKSDVHYCAENAAIKALADRIANDEQPTAHKYLLYKENKQTGEDQLISKIYVDVETLQIVID